MKAFKFGVTFVSSLLMAYSPIASASLNAAQKGVFNQYIKESAKGTYNDFYRNHGGLFDEQSRSMIEGWLANNGNKALPQPQALIIKEKNGSDSLKLIFNQRGRTLTLTFTENNFETFDANGVKIPYHEVRNIPALLNRLSTNDGTLKGLAKAAEQEKFSTPTKLDYLTPAQFAQLSRIQKVEYLSYMRKTLEAAQKVFDVGMKAKAQSALPSASPVFTVFHPLFASQVAWAEIVKEGENCMVAGNLSVYEKSTLGIACNPFPTKFPQSFRPQPNFSDQCTGKGRGRMVACNPLMYGADPSSGAPYCVDSGDRVDFTNKATMRCNDQSPIFSDKSDPDYDSKRRNDMERILKSFFVLKGGDAAKLKDCFNKDHYVSQECRKFFDPQLNEFYAFQKDADKVCATVKLQDQKVACDEYRKRTLDLMGYIDGTNRTVVPVNITKEHCIQSGGRWDEPASDCFCPTGIRGSALPNGQIDCPVPASNVVTVKGKRPDKCENEDGSKSHSLTCDPGLWLGIACVVGVGAWLMCRNKDPKPKGPTFTPPGTKLPPPTIITVPGTPTTPSSSTTTMYVPPTVPPTMPPTTTLPPSEGGNGRPPGSDGNAGGTR